MVGGNGSDWNMAQSQATKHAVLLLMEGIPDYLGFEMSQRDHRRLQGLLIDGERWDEQPFFCFRSPTGFHVILSVIDIQMANFLLDPVQAVEVEYQRPDPEMEDLPIEIYFREQIEPYGTLPYNPEEVATVFVAFDDPDLREEDAFECFRDMDGDLVCLQPDQVVLMIIPDKCIDFGVEE